ncbi:MAG: glycosyltransferase [Candidatus Pacebacteria bacterium]|nr:glycosyltransferase [Candidatus Paceibacterota bacterium]
MNILITFLTYGENTFGGIEHATNNLVHGLRENGHNVSIYTGPFKMKVGIYKKNNLFIYASKNLRIPFDGTDNTIINFLHKKKTTIDSEIKKIIKSDKIDLIICIDHLWGIVPILGLEYSIPTILWLHIFHNKQILKSLENKKYDLFSVSTSLSKEIKNVISKEIKILPNSLIIQNINKTKSKKNYIFVNARISPEKNTIDALKIFEEIANNFKDVKLVLCGGNFPFIDNRKYYQSVIDKIKKSQYTNRISILDSIPWKKIPEIVSNARIILLPTKTESFGLAALEAMAYKTPLITTSSGNLPNLTCNYINLVSPGNISKFTHEVKQELQNKRNSNLNKLKKEAIKYKASTVALNLIKNYEQKK